MASIKQLKKEIQYVTLDLMTETYICNALFEDFTDEKMTELVKRIAKLNNEFITRTNHPEGTKEPRRVKSYFKDLIKHFNEEADSIYDDLSAFCEKK